MKILRGELNDPYAIHVWSSLLGAILGKLRGHVYYNHRTYLFRDENYWAVNRVPFVEHARRVDPHSFWHGFAREYIKNGGDLATLSRLMGHADSAVTTWYYAVFTGKELAEAHDKYSPTKELLDSD